MAIVAGIDEAGYGPVLGPLVVSLAAFEVPDKLADACLWAQLADCIAAKVSKRDPRLPVVDSKKLHHSSAGLAAVEKTALVMLSAGGKKPATFHELLQTLCPAVESHLQEYPWYDHFEVALPLECDPMMISLQANAVRHGLDREGIKFLGGRSCVLPAGQFNSLVGKTRNKATVLWTLTLRLINHMIRHAGERKLLMYIDRQGARVSYARALLTAFEGVDLQILEESEDVSRYQLQCARGRRSSSEATTIEFRQKGESAHLPIALASIYSKYLRELFMFAFNRYWQQHVDGLKRTAGYYQDGSRFLEDIKPAIASLAVDRRILVRSR